jgi:AraC family transcriptional activator of tynA and feaB
MAGERAGLLERRWSTANLPQPEQLPAWRDVVCQAFVPVSVERRSESGPGPFAGTVDACSVGPLGVAQIHSDSQRVRRDAGGIRRRAGDVYFLNLPLTFGAVVAQDGRTARLGAGDFAVIDSTRPFELTFDAPFAQISLALPHDLVAPRFAAPSDATAVRVRGDRGVGAVASATIRGLVQAAGDLDGRAAAALGHQVAELVALALADVGRPSGSRTVGLLRQAALDEVERSLADPGLAPAQIAGRLNISTRYLHRLFSDNGPSFGRWVLQRRLERAHRDLLDPRRAHWTIADIARACGFSDPGHFSRAYRAHFGISPSKARRTSAPA